MEYEWVKLPGANHMSAACLGIILAMTHGHQDVCIRARGGALRARVRFQHDLELGRVANWHEFCCRKLRAG